MPFTSDTIAAQQVQERLRALNSIMQTIEKKRQTVEQGLGAVQKLVASQEENSNSHFQNKYKSLIKTAINQSAEEEAVIREALEKIYEIRSIKNERRIQARQASNKEQIRKGPWMKMLSSSARTLPLFVGKVGEKPPPLCGSIPADPTYIAKIGDMVAALVKDKDEENFIIAEVVSFNYQSSKYEVEDILKEQNQKGRYTLSKRRVVPLPLMRANPETDSNALFAHGTLVMALFPQTTCLYKALVNKPPATHTDDYELLFEDSNYPEGYSPPYFVAQRYVIASKQHNKQT